jgi:hypothetical protein
VEEFANPTIDMPPFSLVQIDEVAEEVGSDSTAPDGVNGCTEYFHDRPGSSGTITSAEEFMHWCVCVRSSCSSRSPLLFFLK